MKTLNFHELGDLELSQRTAIGTPTGGPIMFYAVRVHHGYDEEGFVVAGRHKPEIDHSWPDNFIRLPNGKLADADCCGSDVYVIPVRLPAVMWGDCEEDIASAVRDHVDAAETDNTTGHVACDDINVS